MFEILDLCINMKTGKGSGRKGMGLWEIFVLAVMKHGLNTNYDSLHFHANNNFLLRSVMGIASYDVRKRKEYGLTTIKENVSLLDKKTIDEINCLVVNFGHSVVNKKEDTMLKIKADTFVLESNIHFPTDFNLLWDCARKCIGLAENLSVLLNLQGWRKSKSWRREIKKIFRVTSKNE